VKKNKEIKGLVIDLRNNPGGLLEQAIKISDLFLSEGTIVSTIGRNAKEKEVAYAKKEGTLEGFPIIILMNEYSASASEILGGALQDNGRAAIMGTRSFGKGSVQSVVKLGDGSGLKLTVARYYTPKGRSIQAEGIMPDIALDQVNAEAFEKAVIRRDARREKDIKGHLPGENEKKEELDAETDFWASQTSKDNKPLSPRDQLMKSDFQIQQAYNYLRAWKVFKKFQ
jgi:carboxyl-terminal processing protease